MNKLLPVGAGGFLGATLRYELLGWILSGPTAFPAGTLGAFTAMSAFGHDSFRLLDQRDTGLFAPNVCGAALLVLLTVFAARALVPNPWRQ